MRALVYTGPEQMVLREEPDPQANEDVIVKVAACGICGSDMHAYLGHDSRRPAPLILGHEAAGTATSGLHAGKRVAVNPLVTCGVCDVCIEGRPHLCQERVVISMPSRPGALADFVRVPERNLVPLPDGMPLEQAALTEPMAVCLHAVNLGERLLDRPLAHARTVVLGGGAIGLGSAAVLASRGASGVLVAEPNALRRKRIEGSGRFGAYDPAGERRPADSSIDLVVDCYGGRSSRLEACRIARPGSVIVHVGLEGGEGGVDERKITLQEITFVGSYCYTMAEYRETLRGLSTGLFGAIDWVEERPFAEGVRSFEELRDGRIAAAKVLLRM
jgi:threonine dehydrogenase-like Zn-dependent dehydrogenase